MKKLLTIALTIALILTAMPAITAMAEESPFTWERSERSFSREFISLEELAARLFEGGNYGHSLLSVNLVFTETHDVRLDVWVDEERVDYIILNHDEWCLCGTYIMVDESVIDALVNN